MGEQCPCCNSTPELWAAAEEYEVVKLQLAARDAQLAEAKAEIEKLRESCRTLSEVCDGLADQQAMASDWWKPIRDRAMATASAAPEREERQ